MHKKLLVLFLISSALIKAMDINDNALSINNNSSSTDLNADNKKPEKPKVHSLVLWALKNTPLSYDLKKSFSYPISEIIDQSMPQEIQHLKAILFLNGMICYLPIVNKEIMHLRLARLKIDDPEINEIPISIVTQAQMQYYYLVSGLNHFQYPDYFEKYLYQDNKGLAILIEKQEAERAHVKEPAFFYTTERFVSLDEHFKPDVEKFLARLYDIFPSYLKNDMNIEFPPFLDFKTMGYADKRKTLEIAELLFDSTLHESLPSRFFNPKNRRQKKHEIIEKLAIVGAHLKKINAPKEMLENLYDATCKHYEITNLPE